MTDHILHITGPTAESWELALFLVRLFILSGDEAKAFISPDGVQIVLKCDAAALRSGIEIAEAKGITQ